MEKSYFKQLPWKNGVLPPSDAKRPRCKVLYSYDGVKGFFDEDETDQVDWLITIAYEITEEKK